MFKGFCTAFMFFKNRTFVESSLIFYALVLVEILMEKCLKFADQIKQINGGFDLSHYEIQLLDLTAAAYSLGQPIFVGDLIYQRHIASQATLHASVKKLITKELLCIKPHEGDGRTKELGLTRLALDRYKSLQKAMQRALIR